MRKKWLYKYVSAALAVVLMTGISPSLALASDSSQYSVMLPKTTQHQFNSPRGIAADEDGTMYLADTDNHLIRKYEDGQWLVMGAYGSDAGEFSNPCGVAVGGGFLYVADTGNNRIQKLDTDGNFEDEWGAVNCAAGSEDGEFAAPRAICLVGDVYVLDAGNLRIQELTTDGEFVAAYALPDGLTGPSGLAVSEKGVMYVSDSANDCIYYTSDGGETWDSFGTYGRGEGAFRDPAGLAVDEDGLYVADTRNHRVQKLDAAGNYLESWGVGEGSLDQEDFLHPSAVAVDAAGNLLVADTGNDRVVRIGADGTREIWGSRSQESGGFNRPMDVAVDDDGSIYVSESAANRIQKFNADGTWEKSWALGRLKSGTGTGEFCRPAGLCWSDGVLYVADSGNNRIQCYDGTSWSTLGEKGSTYPGEFQNPTDVAVGPDGALYVADTDNHRIQKYQDSKWSIVVSGLSFPHGISVGDDGSIYVADSGSDRVLVYDESGTLTASYGSYGTGADQFNYPAALDLDEQGRLLVLDTGNDRIQRLENGEWTVFGGTGIQEGEFDLPGGLTVTSSGDILIADTDNHRIIKASLAESADEEEASGGSTRTGSGGSSKEDTLELTLTGAVDADGKLTASVTEHQLDQLRESAETYEAVGTAPVVALRIDAAATVSAVTLTLPGAAFQRLADETQAALSIDGSFIAVTFNSTAVDYLSDTASGGDISITLSTGTELQDQTSIQALSGRPLYDVSVTAGSTSVSSLGSGAATLSIPYTPESDEEFNALVIYTVDAEGEAVVSTKSGYDIDAGAMYCSTQRISSYVAAYHQVVFSDVAEDAWYEDAVTFCAARDITKGSSNTTFSPDSAVTRAQFLVLLMRAYELAPDDSGGDNFADAGDTYYTGYLKAASELGLAQGVGNNLFEPEASVSRQDMATLLYRALEMLGELPEASSGKTLSDYSDSQSVSDYAKTAFEAMVDGGVMTGSGGALSPEAVASRAQIAQVLYNLLGN